MIEQVFAAGHKIKGIDFILRNEPGGAHAEINKGVREHVFKASLFSKCKALWLPYVPNGINYTDVRGMDVISGPFSGCIMGLYFYKGTRRVCHVATGENGDLRPVWTNLKKNKDYVMTQEFLPHNVTMGVYGKKMKGNAYFLGAITADGRLYTFLVTASGKKQRGTTINAGGFRVPKWEGNESDEFTVLQAWKR